MKERSISQYNDFWEIVNGIKLEKGWVSNLLDIQKVKEELYSHITRVAYISYNLAKKDDIKEFNLKDLVTASLLHDVGKVYIPKDIVDSQSKLSSEEWSVMQEHVRAGFNIIRPFDERVAEIMIAHHEFQNNSYPRGQRKTNDETLFKMQYILALADHTDSLLSPRSYKPAWPEDIARNELIQIFKNDILVDKAIEVRKSIASFSSLH